MGMVAVGTDWGYIEHSEGGTCRQEVPSCFAGPDIRMDRNSALEELVNYEHIVHNADNEVARNDRTDNVVAGMAKLEMMVVLVELILLVAHEIDGLAMPMSQRKR